MKLIPITEEIKRDERSLYISTFLGVVYGGVACIFPYLIKEFHSISPAKRFITNVIIFCSVFGNTVYPPYNKIRTTNRQIIK